MKTMTFLVKSIFLLQLLACFQENTIKPNEQQYENTDKMKITVGTSTFSATLQSNATANAFRESLPITLTMSELNNNEKYADLEGSLPTNASNPGTIQNGDLMLYGSSTLVLFYKSFSTSYRYTKIGRIDDPKGLEEALGTGDVSITFDNN
jgi:hypothetical protein